MVNLPASEPIDQPPTMMATRGVVWAQRLRGADLAAVHLISRSARSTAGRVSAVAISRLGNSWLYLLIVPIVFAALGREGFRVVFLGCLNAALLHLMFPIIKRKIGRPRPFQADPRLRSLAKVLDEHSFPSGHTMTLSGVLTPIVLVWPGAILVALALMLLMTWARIATAHHYPSDAFAGAILGIVLAYPLSILVLALW